MRLISSEERAIYVHERRRAWDRWRNKYSEAMNMDRFFVFVAGYNAREEAEGDASRNITIPQVEMDEPVTEDDVVKVRMEAAKIDRETARIRFNTAKAAQKAVEKRLEGWQ